MKDWTGNGNSIYKTLGASNHTDKEREENDYYATDPIAIDKLFAVETFHDNIWECACGGGHLSQRMKELGKEVVSTDIIKRTELCDALIDFLSIDHTPDDNVNFDIITNPPYKFATEFVERAIDLVNNECKVAMFLKLTFLESQRRRKLFDKYPPKIVYVFSERVLCAKNAEFEEMRAGGGSAVAYAWFIWEKGYTGDTIIKWI